MSFELLSVPDDYTTEVAMVVAPYVDVKFMKELIGRMKPKRVCLLVDDGIRKEDLVALREACEDLEIRLGRSRGLMHMKAFYFEFMRNKGQRRRKRRLLLGSANATNSAFSGHINAELIADVELSISFDTELADYFRSILASFGESDSIPIKAQRFCLGNAPLLHLPAFESIEVGLLPTAFDTWLQRGRLTAKYRDAPQFGVLNIQLKAALPRDQVAQIFANRAFTEQGERDVVRYAYVNDAVSVEPDAEQTRWKARFSVWTHLGDWISDECYQAHRNIMRSKAADARAAKVSTILRGFVDDEWQQERIATLITALKAVWNDLRRADIVPEIYLEGRNGKLNPEPYEKQFRLKLKQDFHLAEDQDFKHRYIQGYEFPDMPRFRQDNTAWERFVRSWCESISVEAAKGRTLSLVVQRLKGVLEDQSLDLEAMKVSEIAAFLRERWTQVLPGSEMTLGEWLTDYHDMQ